MLKIYIPPFPKCDAIDLLKYRLTLNKTFNNNAIKEIIQSIDVIFNQNYFQYNSKICTKMKVLLFEVH